METITIATAKQLKERFLNVRSQTSKLTKPLKPEDYVVQPVVDVSPPKWHLAHTTWFFEQFVLLNFDKDYCVYDKDYSYLFNSYYETVGTRVLRADRGNLTRPGTHEIMKYRTYVDEGMCAFFDQNEELEDNVCKIIELGLQHEQQHQELLVTDIKYILGHNPLFPVYKENLQNTNGVSQVIGGEYKEIDEGVYSIGHADDDFHFDNEKGRHKVYLHAFRYLNRLITNGEYLEFIEAGGYQDFRYWFMEAWEWVKTEGINAPLYWFKIENDWYHYKLSGFQKVDLYEPVTHISMFEADAFANWKGKRLLTEFEWEVACKQGSPQINKNANFVETEHYHPITRQKEDSQLFGDTWEWTGSAYQPYPYYQRAEGALGEYNGKFMINQKVLRGGSCATPADHIRHTYRNFFHPHLRWQFTGIRLAESI
ncbi:ergothioneine biosynthesis protein EgtB [Fulvivirgaceae bacterium BMA10]|uniref:Ergothioneine biosynthesis protein EgtB n=1 Tax=Splendidivirga corallicola TaxID=3051826 RepID=A0ABT8KW59_9BACT|nr:ergothioneine biosynthesis protein EgtB [Fulvivirgaceae bacterium BMA10]